MIKIGLTGNRYSGKNTICKMFKQIGVPVFDADVVLKFILTHDLPTLELIKSKYGDRYLDGYFIDRRLVKTKEDFNSIVDCAEHSLIKAYEIFNSKNHVYSIFKSSILFERSWSKNVDYTINVFCPKIHRMERYKQLTGIKVADIAFNLRNEIDDLEKNRMSNFIIHNYEGSANVLDQVNKIDQFLIDDFLERKKNEVRTTSDGKGIILSHY